MQKTPRLFAIQYLNNIINDHRSLSSIKFPHALTQEIVYGTLRWYWRLTYILEKFLSKPLKKDDEDIRLLLLIGLYQLLFLDLPQYAAVNETVNVTKDLKKPWAKKLVNAVLRNVLRNPNTLDIPNDALAPKYAHPKWFMNAVREAWPKHWRDILNANNQHPPFWLRVNIRNAKREDYLPCEHHPYNHCGIILPAQNIQSVKGFDQGHISVQDGSAQLAASLLDLKPGQIVLDACAAPGGKTTHILETEPALKQLVALDIDQERLNYIQSNIIRATGGRPCSIGTTTESRCLSIKNTPIILMKGDAQHPETWWDKTPFDRILLDAPCSASGVIRRHPDIKFLRQQKDIGTLAQKQLKILNALWPLLKPNGLLVYATCSIFPEENKDVIQQFLTMHTDAKEKIIDQAWGLQQTHGRQILPGMDNMDGFYYACLEKV